MSDESKEPEIPTFDMDETLVRVNPPTIPLDCQPVYASTHNILNHPVYNRLDCYLRPQAAEALAEAAQMAGKDGYIIRLFDAYRPLEAQYIFWEHTPDPDYVADPRLGSTHGRGVAVDVTLLGEDKMPLPMGTEYDDFTEVAHHRFTDLPEEILENRKRLRGYMEMAGFVIHAPEWWHYNLPAAERFDLIADGAVVPPMLRPEMAARAQAMMAKLGISTGS